MKQMNDLLAKAKALEAQHRRPTTGPRHWAAKILEGTAKLEEVPEHLRGIVEDHLATAKMHTEAHRLHVQAAADRILALPNGKARLAAFNALPEALRGPVRERVHAMRGK